MKAQSHINLLAGKASFTTEPLAYRLAVVVLLAVFLLLVAVILKGWILSFAVPGLLSGKATKMAARLQSKLFKS